MSITNTAKRNGDDNGESQTFFCGLYQSTKCYSKMGNILARQYFCVKSITRKIN